MLGFRKVRKAVICNDEERAVFDRLGEAGIQLTLASGFTPRSKGLRKIYQDDPTAEHAEAWLTERTDIRRKNNTISG